MFTRVIGLSFSFFLVSLSGLLLDSFIYQSTQIFWNLLNSILALEIIPIGLLSLRAPG
jgi:hypothetical protein